MNIPRLVALGLIALTSLANGEKTEEISLIRIQKLLVAHKMVDLPMNSKKGFHTGRDFRMKSVTGAIVVVSFPKPKGGSGFPARVFAILP